MMPRTLTLTVIAALAILASSCREAGQTGIVNVPWGIKAEGYPAHVEINWNSSNGA